jgi:hypothetical protein
MEENKAKITVRSQGGHVLVLDDSDNGTKIELSTTDGRKVTLDDTEGVVTVADPSGNELTMDGNANTVTVKSTGDMKETAGGNLTIKVTGSAKIQSASGVTIDSSDIKLGASAALTLVNDTFLTLFNTHTHVGNLGGPTSPPLVPAVKNVQSTIITKGA